MLLPNRIILFPNRNMSFPNSNMFSNRNIFPNRHRNRNGLVLIPWGSPIKYTHNMLLTQLAISLSTMCCSLRLPLHLGCRRRFHKGGGPSRAVSILPSLMISRCPYLRGGSVAHTSPSEQSSGKACMFHTPRMHVPHPPHAHTPHACSPLHLHACSPPSPSRPTVANASPSLLNAASQPPSQSPSR